jgi:acyl carrier protein
VQRGDVLMQVQSILREELDDPSIHIDDETKIDELPDWDSAAHVQILVAMEGQFDILFEVEEYSTFTCLREMIDCICDKLNRKQLNHKQPNHKQPK